MSFSNLLPKALTKAQVLSLKECSTARGQRIYAVFKTADGFEVGLWAPADEAALRQLRIGDVVALKRDARGNLRLPKFTPGKQRSHSGESLRFSLFRGGVKSGASR